MNVETLVTIERKEGGSFIGKTKNGDVIKLACKDLEIGSTYAIAGAVTFYELATITEVSKINVVSSGAHRIDVWKLINDPDLSIYDFTQTLVEAGI